MLGISMVTRSKKNRLERWEVAIIKAMLALGTFGNDQDILAYFTRPTRSINHRVISEIRTGAKHTRATAASDAELQGFLKNWPMIDPNTGLHLRGDELLIKAREAMLLAVQAYNNPTTYFRSEVFIVLAVIAWTYLLHAYFKSRGTDYRYTKINADGAVEVQTTKHGAEKYWELAKCLKSADCPVEPGTKRNLEFLLEVRHEIEHRMTTRIDNAVSAKLQACCLNFNRTIQDLFGDQLGLDAELSFALQFANISPKQNSLLRGSTGLPAHIETMRVNFEDGLTEDEYKDPQYAYRVLFVPKTVNKKGQADEVVEFVKAGSEEAEALNTVYLKETEKEKFKPGKIVSMMRAEGFPNFSVHNHTILWQALDAKAAGKGYGIHMSDGQWYWYEKWVGAVRQHCEENRNIYAE